MKRNSLKFGPGLFLVIFSMMASSTSREQRGGQIHAHTTVIDENEPLSGDINRWCHYGGIIRVP